MALTSNFNYLQPTGFKLVIDRKNYPNLEFFVQDFTHAGVIMNTADLSYKKIASIPFIGDKIFNASGQNIFSFYIPDFSRLKDFFGPALALASLAVLDSLLSCKVADNMIGDRHSSDRETFGQGMANMAAGLVGGVTTATATMRTVANIKFGGKTPLSSIVHGLTLLAILLGMSSFVAAIPAACLAAILFNCLLYTSDAADD